MLLPSVDAFTIGKPDFVSRRPALSERHFTSEAVEATINMKKALPNKELAWMFENCFPNTLDTTVYHELKNGVPDTYVITGDIDAMWLRDSTEQVWPYVPLAAKDPKLRQLLARVKTGQDWRKIAVSLKKNIRRHLWLPSKGKYLPHIYLNGSPFSKDFKEEELLYSGGSACAILAGLNTPAEIAVINKQLVISYRKRMQN